MVNSENQIKSINMINTFKKLKKENNSFTISSNKIDFEDDFS